MNSLKTALKIYIVTALCFLVFFAPVGVLFSLGFSGLAACYFLFSIAAFGAIVVFGERQ